MVTYSGGCHCGNISVGFETEKPIPDLGTRFCTCTYCQKQNARYASDPEGLIRLAYKDADNLVRYRFGTGQADFISCRQCAVYVGAVASRDDQARMVLNINTLDEGRRFQMPEDFDYDGEEPDARKARWFTRWTPVVETT